ncbi:hypothetical protein ACROYT_G042764 [Oculina patagonica]
MNATNTWNASPSIKESSIPPTRPYHDKVDYNVSNVYKFIFGGIAIVSFLGNFLFCVAICRRRSLLSKTYNVLVLSLAITDMLTEHEKSSSCPSRVIKMEYKMRYIPLTYAPIGRIRGCGKLTNRPHNFAGNFCVVRRRKLLSKTYNILMLSLAITDMLTGIFLVATPDYLIDRKKFPYPSGLAGEIYCRLIGSTYILFIFGKASTSTIMCLAIDRWYSIVKPIRYKTAFSKRRLYMYITLIWASAAITQINELFITEVTVDGLCTFVTPFYGAEAERILILLHVVITFYIPSIVTWVTFGHIWMHMRQPNIRRHLDNNKATKRLLRMCALAAFFLTVCWFPTETFFILFKFKILELPFEVNLFTSILAMSNSCLNPWIYCLSNREYRREFVRLLCCIKFNVGSSRISSLCFGLVRKRRSRYSFSSDVDQTSINVNQVDGSYVLRLRQMPQASSLSLSTMTSFSNIACSEAN